MSIVHHHLLLQIKVEVVQDSLSESDLRIFIFELLKIADMKVLIKPQFKLSHQRAWTGIMGIITSHIAFHYWIDEGYLQLDIYSCKEFDKKKVLDYVKEFWKISGGKALFIKREVGEEFKIERTYF